MLELASICKRLGDFQLRDISLRIEDGEYFVLLGPSGVGKTILLEILAGLIQPDRGQIRWQGHAITGQPPQKRRFALVYQDYALFPHMTVLQNIAYGLRACGIKLREARARASQMAEVLSIQELLGRSVQNLSGGEKQRVALARALVTDPQMVLLDEPLAAVDSNLRAGLRQVLRDLHRCKGKTFLHVTHDMDDALYLGERIGVLLNGGIQQVGTPHDLFQNPSDRHVADFLDLKNVLAVDEASDGICVVGGIEIMVPSADHSVEHILIRPEEILLSHQPFDSSARNQFRCCVHSWEHSGSLLVVRVAIHHSQGLVLAALISHYSFRKLGVKVGAPMYCTFKLSTVHCL